MLEKMIKSYYDFFDKKIKHSTLIVVIISMIIIIVWLIFSSKDIFSYSKSSVVESNIWSSANIITISWVKYRVILEKID